MRFCREGARVGADALGTRGPVSVGTGEPDQRGEHARSVREDRLLHRRGPGLGRRPRRGRRPARALAGGAAPGPRRADPVAALRRPVRRHVPARGDRSPRPGRGSPSRRRGPRAVRALLEGWAPGGAVRLPAPPRHRPRRRGRPPRAVERALLGGFAGVHRLPRALRGAARAAAAAEGG